jgi:hypothetical protein
MNIVATALQMRAIGIANHAQAGSSRHTGRALTVGSSPIAYRMILTAIHTTAHTIAPAVAPIGNATKAHETALKIAKKSIRRPKTRAMPHSDPTAARITRKMR